MSTIKRAKAKPAVYMAFPDGVFHYVCRLPPFGEPLMTFAVFEILRVAAKGQPLTGVFEKTLTCQ
jgi:hypothetical protein